MKVVCWLCAWSYLAVVVGLDNGLALTPPRGWRSWNAFDCTNPARIITQERMTAQMVAIVDKSRLVNGKNTSLADLGFDYVSMDDGWQQCNCSTRQDLDPSLPKCPNLCFGGHCTFHDQTGTPLIRKDRFPDMKTMVDYGHSVGLKVGTYLNNCICMEAGKSATHYKEDAKWLTELGFDGVKIDACGTSHNVSEYADLFNATGRPVRIENCHNSWPDFKTGFCPMNFFRTGGDISANIGDIIGEAYGTVDASDLLEPRSGPGCWGYPDMSEVGNFAEGPSQIDQEQTHWALWCIVSSPLILGFDMNNSATMDRVWPIITNLDALNVSEAWAGHPGTLIKVYDAVDQGTQVVQGPCDGSVHTMGWKFDNGSLIAPNTGAGPQQCLLQPKDASCPPPTTRSKDLQCGLQLSNCTARMPSDGSWKFVNHSIQWQPSGGNTQCMAAFPLNFNVSAGYYVRSAAKIKMEGCTHLTQMLPQGSSCIATREHTDFSGPKVIHPTNASKVCGVDMKECCAVCDADKACVAFVWKKQESFGIGCPGTQSYCWLVSNFSGIHSAKDGTFGSKMPVPSPPPTPSPTPTPPSPPPPPGPGYFNMTAKGELRAGDGKCLRAAPTHGVQLWSKPMSHSKTAVLLVNPLNANQTLTFPLSDVPHFPGSANFACNPGKCRIRDVWNKTESLATSAAIRIALRPFASAFYILTDVRTAPEWSVTV